MPGTDGGSGGRLGFSLRSRGHTCSWNTARALSQTLRRRLGPSVLNRSALIGVAQDPSERQSLFPGLSCSSAVP